MIDHRTELRKGRDYTLRVLELLDQQVFLQHVEAQHANSNDIPAIETYAALRRDLARKAEALNSLHGEFAKLVDRVFPPGKVEATR